jgi:PAS domain S-box-containing protein
MDINDYILSTDEDFETITGYTLDDVENKWLRQEDLIPEDQREDYFEDVGKQLQKGDVVYMEHDIVRKDGKHVYVFCFAKRHYDSASKTMRTEVIIVDSSTTRAFGHREGGMS